MSKFDFKALRKNGEGFKEFFSENDKLGALLGASLISVDDEECLFEYTVSPEHFNPNQILHGGALCSVVDSSQGAFVHFILDAKYKYAATGTATILSASTLDSC